MKVDHLKTEDIHDSANETGSSQDVAPAVTVTENGTIKLPEDNPENFLGKGGNSFRFQPAWLHVLISL